MVKRAKIKAAKSAKAAKSHVAHHARKSRAVKVYSNLAHKRRTKKDAAARKKAEYLATLPKHPVKRTLYRLHPKRVAKFWFSKKGGLVALKLAGLGLLIGMIIVGSVFAYFRKDLDSVRPGSLAERVQTTVSVYKDRNGKVLWEDKGSGNYRLAVDSDEISDYMKEATIAIEDRDFYRHGGVSFTGIIRSAVNNASTDSVQGGSTLTQQLVKQVFLADEAYKRGFDGIPRKIKEVILAVEVERKYNKDQILNLYLNEASYGGRRNGVESAAQTFFKKPAKDLTLAEASMVAAIPNQPSYLNPYNEAGNEALIVRQHATLDAMVETGAITREQADAAKKIPILDKVKPESDQLAGVKAPHFVLLVKQELERELGSAIVGRGGLTVTTTLDLRIQQKLEEETKKMFASSTPEYYGFSNAATTIEDVKTGQIVAMMGSRDFQYPGFGENNAAVASIQPGSSIKPLVYAKLFEDKGEESLNFGSGSILADDRGADEIYGAELQNWDGKYRGAIDIRDSLAWSRNVPAVKAMYINGVQPTLDYIRAFGDKSYCTVGPEATVGLAASIGGCGAKQVEHVNAIASLARLGVYKPYSTFLEVKNISGDVLAKYKSESKRVGSKEASYIVAEILADEGARAGLFGPVNSLNIPGVRSASKTGTSDIGGESRDFWTVTYTPVLAGATWVGNNDTRTLRVSNSSVPAQILSPTLEFAHKEVYAKDGRWNPGDWYTQPEGIQVIRGELYPSWYNKAQAQSTEKLTFDRVSRKRATECTPAGARIEVSVVKVKDPITDKFNYIANDGYDAREEDDAHSCSDAKPNVTVSVLGDGETISVNFTKGKFPLRNVTVSVNGSTVANISPSGSGSRNISSGLNGDEDFTVTATITDEGYYSSSSSTSWEANTD